jgi:hypothetical protein
MKRKNMYVGKQVQINVNGTLTTGIISYLHPNLKSEAQQQVEIDVLHNGIYFSLTLYTYQIYAVPHITTSKSDPYVQIT